MSPPTVAVINGRDLDEPGALAVTAVRAPDGRLVVEVRFGAAAVVRLPLGERESGDVARRITAAGERALDLLSYPDKAAAVAACHAADPSGGAPPPA
ncbi:hypothetical protein [Marinactinospora rubrisoli]|uniref:Uncharacterized protein n=1 Tax=Marinactinospora rubrisoli TaxID=2715399 RepID=A0ABW2KPS1_9ACTN